MRLLPNGNINHLRRLHHQPVGAQCIYKNNRNPQSTIPPPTLFIWKSQLTSKLWRHNASNTPALWRCITNASHYYPPPSPWLIRTREFLLTRWGGLKAIFLKTIVTEVFVVKCAFCLGSRISDEMQFRCSAVVCMNALCLCVFRCVCR